MSEVQRIERDVQALSALRESEYEYKKLQFLGEIALQLAKLRLLIENKF